MVFVISARVARTSDAPRSRWLRKANPTRPPATSSAWRPGARMKSERTPRRPSHGKKTLGSSRLPATASPSSLLDELVHLNEGHQDRERDEPDGPAHEDDHERLEQARERLHPRLDLRVVRSRHVLEHRLDLPASLADGDHVRHERRKVAAPLERARDRLALADAAGRGLDDLLELAVVEDALDDLHRLEERHAAAKERREGAGEARDREHADECPEDGHLQEESVLRGAARGRGDPGEHPGDPEPREHADEDA